MLHDITMRFVAGCRPISRLGIGDSMPIQSHIVGENRPPRPQAMVGAIPHILHIDDEENERLQFSRAFFSSGVTGVLHSLSTASNALLYLNQKGPFAGAPRPCLIIVDLHLPRSGGRQFHEMLQTNYQWKDIDLIVLSGPQQHADIDRCHALGIHHFRRKPRTDAEAIALIQSLARELLGQSPTPPD